MVNQWIVLGHVISSRGIEVDKEKIELIFQLSSPRNLKTVRQFLGHAGFYRRFIKDFLKIAKPLYKLLEKDAKFSWEKDCQESFEELKFHLTTAPIVQVMSLKVIYFQSIFLIDFLYKKTDLYAGIWNKLHQIAVQ